MGINKEQADLQAEHLEEMYLDYLEKGGELVYEVWLKELPNKPTVDYNQWYFLGDEETFFPDDDY